MPDHSVHPASYRDPSGFVFQSGTLYYRQVNKSYAQQYDEFLRSGLYDALTQKGWLVPHTEIGENLTGMQEWYKTLLPRQIPFISHPAEWSPAQLKAAALLTLRVQLLSIEHGMIVKDASPFNIQFVEGKPIFIDTLSFEHYNTSTPWVAYRQFCENFLFPLYIHHYRGGGCHKILSAWPEGIPAAATLKLLPFGSRFNLGVWLYVYLPGKVQEDIRPGGAGSQKAPPFSRKKMEHLISHLESTVKRLTTTGAEASAWNDYYDRTISSPAYLQAKEETFRSFLQDLPWKSALDLGANDGYFSRILSEAARPAETYPDPKTSSDQETSPNLKTSPGLTTSADLKTIIAVDSDWQCIQRLYETKGAGSSSPILPLVVDLANPTPASGFHHTERDSFTSRSRSDLVIALALIHHLALAKNIPLPKIAAYLTDLTKEYLIAEFVPLGDEKSQELIRNKTQWHDHYDENGFEAAFGRYFTIERKETISGSRRILYLMKRQNRIIILNL